MTNYTIGIIGAMEPEVELLKNAMLVEKEDKIAHATAYAGTLNGQNIVLVQSGIGKVNASIITALLLERYNIDYVINTGVAGAMGENLKVTDMVVSTEVLHHDVDATNFGYSYGQVPGMPAVYTSDEMLVRQSLAALSLNDEINGSSGLVVSGDSFIDSDAEKENIFTNFPDAMCVDMESASIAQTCWQFNTPFVIIRSMSDSANESADMNYEEFLAKACVHSSEVVKSLLRVL
ncbi:MAG TPA: 5'-methylthioadenosine/S-adenosylhomocysteine nucleosidase [Jeotgalicoccus sp.]|nr:5'-methylthioadenosine/adenosylhomocysteine nucleosidase [Jeotgalicoccus sp.]HBV22544.1 5'-methylthioadenosine/S-adenosylhomocysteine nucleosidase [Jeotgalicoccus sp.]